MAQITIPDAVGSAETLTALEAALERTKQEINQSAESLQELERFAQENLELETKIEEMKRTMYLLVYERLQAGMLASSKEYVGAIEKEIEALSPKPAKAEGTSKS